MSQRSNKRQRADVLVDSEVRPALAESQLLATPGVGFFVEEWAMPTEGMRYAVPADVGGRGSRSVEEWLVVARRTRRGEVIQRHRIEWLGEEKSLVPIRDEFRRLVTDLVGKFGGCRGTERAIEANIARLPQGRHRARYRVTRKQLERIAGHSGRRFAQWRTLDALASIAPQLGVGTAHGWHAAIQPQHVTLGLGLYRTWCISQAPGQLLLPLPRSVTAMIQRFSKRWLRAGQESFRVALAVRRSLEPLLLASHAGAGIECSIQEMVADDPFKLFYFVRHGLEREDMLFRGQRGTGRHRAGQRYSGELGPRAWSQAVRLTRQEVEGRMKELERVLRYLDFVEVRHRG